MSISQNSIGAGIRFNLNHINEVIGVSKNQSNQSYKLPAFEFIGTNSTQKQGDSSRFTLGYTFEIGLSLLKFTETNISIPNEPLWISDTIGIERKIDFFVKKIHITNYIDFKIKLNKKLTLINSIGLKIENRDGYTKVKNSKQSTYILENDIYPTNLKQNNTTFIPQNSFPLNFKLVILPQLQIKLEDFDIKIQLYQDLLNINNYINAIDIGTTNYTTLTGIGIVISTKPKQEKSELEYKELYSSE